MCTLRVVELPVKQNILVQKLFAAESTLFNRGVPHAIDIIKMTCISGRQILSFRIMCELVEYCDFFPERTFSVNGQNISCGLLEKMRVLFCRKRLNCCLMRWGPFSERTNFKPYRWQQAALVEKTGIKKLMTISSSGSILMRLRCFSSSSNSLFRAGISLDT